MRFPSRALWMFALAQLGMALLFARPAAARSCAADADCPMGFQCLGGTCLSLSCQGNASCGGGTVCEMNIGTTCVQDADGGQTCGPASACVPQWQAPCMVDSDCGDGFQCVTDGMVCDCGSAAQQAAFLDGGGTLTPCDDIPMPPIPPCVGDAGCPHIPSLCEAGSTCVCETTRYCQEMPMAACQISSDCLAGWTCLCPPSGGIEIPADASLGDGGCASMTCEPPNWDLSTVPTNGVAAGSVGTSPASGPGGATATSAPGAATATSGSSVASSGSASSDGAVSETSPTAPSSSMPNVAGGGCSIGPALSGNGGGLLSGLAPLTWAAFGLGLMRRRR